MNSKLPYVNPRNGLILNLQELGFESYAADSIGEKFAVTNGILRVSIARNYADSFGFQWRVFSTTQIDRLNDFKKSEERLFAETEWTSDSIHNLHILEVGCGAGRFTDILLRKSQAYIYSIDYSSAIDITKKNNQFFENRLSLAQASLFEIPFPKNSFDKVLCLGVLQHTHSVEGAIRSLVAQAKLNGEIIVDFYQLKGWYTWIHAKYIFRLITPRIPPEVLLRLISRNIRWLLLLFDTLCFLRLGILTRFLPIADMRGLPKHIGRDRRIEWAVLDTFDALSPRYDKPQKINEIVAYFESFGCRVDFADIVNFPGSCASVVRATKITSIAG